MLNLFQHLATVEFHGYSKRLPQGRNMGQTLNQVVSDYSGLHSQSTPLYFAVAKWPRRLAVCSYGLGSLRSRGALPKILQGDMKMLDCTPAKIQRNPLHTFPPWGEGGTEAG